LVGLLVVVVCLSLVVVALNRFPAIRIVVLVAAFAGAAVVWWIVDREQARRALAHDLIPLQRIELKDMHVVNTSGAFQLAGAVHNGSPKYTLTELIVQLAVADCPNETAKDDECEIIADALARAHSPWNVAPKETKDLNVDFKMAELPPAKGVVRWIYSVAQTRAAQP
jgi:hypothetical protein